LLITNGCYIIMTQLSTYHRAPVVMTILARNLESVIMRPLCESDEGGPSCNIYPTLRPSRLRYCSCSLTTILGTSLACDFDNSMSIIYLVLGVRLSLRYIFVLLVVHTRVRSGLMPTVECISADGMGS